MGISRAIDWWDEWKLRILVLCSLVVQFLLYFSGYVRHRYILRRLRVMKQQQTTACADLEVTWAPVFLIHLCGQPTISAYSLEDNELWKRHAITLVSQVTVALYVFCKWWSDPARSHGHSVALAMATWLPPICRRHHEEQKKNPALGGAWRRLGTWCIAVCTFTDVDDGGRDIPAAQLLEEKPPAGGEKRTSSYSLEEYVKEAQEHVKEGRKGSGKAQREKFTKDEALVSEDIYMMFLDLAAPYSVRLRYLRIDFP
ncbi:hypothetical protein C2845_PM05G14640 [Panicum miliaceum]|uniref:DUF4220 domain-containing protein n=1 Tax=Panicum miliaceum TaxID=4540 RepID=A0A3L6T1Q0_PANMI|nr:hypothetical protein C2845_PM05G14640 [Panicum miliaceum]